MKGRTVYVGPAAERAIHAIYRSGSVQDNMGCVCSADKYFAMGDNQDCIARIAGTEVVPRTISSEGACDLVLETPRTVSSTNTTDRMRQFADVFQFFHQNAVAPHVSNHSVMRSGPHLREVQQDGSVGRAFRILRYCGYGVEKRRNLPNQSRHGSM
jgi:hypothetical protein